MFATLLKCACVLCINGICEKCWAYTSVYGWVLIFITVYLFLKPASPRRLKFKKYDVQRKTMEYSMVILPYKDLQFNNNSVEMKLLICAPGLLWLSLPFISLSVFLFTALKDPAVFCYFSLPQLWSAVWKVRRTVGPVLGIAVYDCVLCK